MVTAWGSTVTKKRQRWSSPSTLNKLAHRKPWNAHVWYWNHVSPSMWLVDFAKISQRLNACKKNREMAHFPKKKSAVRMWEFISFIIRTGAHWTRELDSKFALQRLFLHFYVILYYDSKYNHDFSYPKSKLREMWLNGEFHGLLSLSLGHLCG